MTSSGYSGGRGAQLAGQQQRQHPHHRLRQHADGDHVQAEPVEIAQRRRQAELGQDEVHQAQQRDDKIDQRQADVDMGDADGCGHGACSLRVMVVLAGVKRDA